MHSTARPESNRTSHYRLFKRTAEKAHIMIAGNEILGDYARKYCQHVHVLPTGLDVESYYSSGPKKRDDRIRLVWIGSQSTLPYLAEIIPVLEEIGASNKKVVLRIIADRFFDLVNMEVERRQWSLTDQVRNLQECDIGLSPLPDNRFTRGKCGFKILQYFATGLPVIASPVGINETLLLKSGAGLLASTPEEWENAIQSMLLDLNSWSQKAERGRLYVQRFDSSNIGKKLSEILKSVVEK
jgi:glycosyltransferase involved in cell wall biosynthesis